MLSRTCLHIYVYIPPALPLSALQHVPRNARTPSLGLPKLPLRNSPTSRFHVHQHFLKAHEKHSFVSAPTLLNFPTTFLQRSSNFRQIRPMFPNALNLSTKVSSNSSNCSSMFLIWGISIGFAMFLHNIPSNIYVPQM